MSQVIAVATAIAGREGRRWANAAAGAGALHPRAPPSVSKASRCCSSPLLPPPLHAAATARAPTSCSSRPAAHPPARPSSPPGPLPQMPNLDSAAWASFIGAVMSFGYSFLSLGMSIYQLVTCESLDSMEADAATSRMHGDRRRGGGGGGGGSAAAAGRAGGRGHRWPHGSAPLLLRIIHIQWKLTEDRETEQR